MTGWSRRRILGAALLAATAPLATAAPPLASTAQAATGQWLFRRGVNTWPWFALTREFPAPRTDYDWPPFQPQRPVPTPADLARLRASGLDFIRLPIDPGPFLAAGAGQRARLITMLSAAVEAALGADLGVIVNVQANGATHYWNPDRMYSSTTAPEFAGYQVLVGEVAGMLADMAPGRIALEPVNEPPQDCSSEVWPKVQAALLTAARGSARKLPLLATGGCGSMVRGLTALDPAPLADYEPILFTFHFYEPYLFSHQGAPWMREPVYRALNNVPWPASAGTLEQTLASVRARMAGDMDRSEEAKKAAYAETERVLKVFFDAQPDRRFVDGYLRQVSNWAEKNGIAPGRIIMGEFGALRTDARYIAAPNPDRARYIADVRQSAEAAGFPWAFWDLFDGMGMMDDTTRALDPAMVEALGLRMPRT
ncbi:glycosyl hydrolase family 5 [Mesorhizobium sp. M2D.F.Ca.ET.185.01.1.1]|uniref:glycoside hydrolase family 5 protein n=1 Tax=unclassified Mesorhizobium TaxID=325217 RepID=UPI000FCC7BF2|nr:MULTISPECIES: cellulase family glycosylhydrolase [unclassified Mesorhizobium]TGP79438.1 glycosyl hydrolase family 5 [bacterium M00.F.Ca.ET.227.01.1.1]TGQ00823.1 glycosyl hydrolase family 5 [bacterium M00.F.Ca.ET.221.01.1.1]TGQ02656.1 glycosyl hydrolase family 5 [bacterium M00.F.Ca.ET.222.01.1.1]TGU12549.1 glycosyl hydrolase family 5 [bacterium M00.F.Ca.ET.163.01.1.1]TGU34522.1 glycosyl hydrolase family 5 [bacterium M00.F.Ca.ET.156.01.1.1]TGU46486.1 glycosyl hydrolase family 5 [bacterium M0